MEVDKGDKLECLLAEPAAYSPSSGIEMAASGGGGGGGLSSFCLLEEEPIFSYEWPNVYDEARDMLLSAILMYGVVDLRTLARRRRKRNTNNIQQNQQDGSSPTTRRGKQQQEDDFLMEQLLSLPISAKDIVRLLGQHRDTIEQEIGRQSTDLYLDAFDSIYQTTCSARELELEFTNGKISLVSFDVVVVDDNNQEEELVYAICVDTSRRRITILFRGCSTSMDWSVCASNFLKERDNPLYNNSSPTSPSAAPQNNADDDDDLDPIRQHQQPEKISIHQGYCSYLFRVNPKTGINKFDSIVRHVNTLLRKHPGYQIYVTGHSLGAALATVFAFEAAATQQFVQVQVGTGAATTTTTPVTVTCINFASPMVGNYNFETAFRCLESQGKIRCLRVTNHFDIFTQLPDRGNWLYVFACCWGFHFVTYVGWTLLFFMCWSNHVYRHVGMDLHMYRYHTCSSHNVRDYCGNLFFSNNNSTTDEDHHYQQQQEQPPQRCSYKIKHPRGTPHNFVWRVAQDWKKHMKQTIQRLLAVPLAVNFNTNHSVQEHLWRLTQLSSKLDGVYLKDLYDTKRFPHHHQQQEGEGGLSPSSTTTFTSCNTNNNHHAQSSFFRQCDTCPV